MITRLEFDHINQTIIDSLKQTFQSLRILDLSNYILFLANGEYLENTPVGFNPYTIDYIGDIARDETRNRFLNQFLKKNYSFSSLQLIDDDDERLHVELMIYTHIWESKSFLKRLYRLSHIMNGEDYPWNVNVPEMGKHDFIRNDIRKTFKDSGNSIWLVIKNGFHTSLRNAFAHSEYSFDMQAKKINLYNYKGDEWELKNISFNDWSKRFVYSILLSYYLSGLKQEARKKLVTDFESNIFTIKHPNHLNGVFESNIIYDTHKNKFRFE